MSNERVIPTQHVPILIFYVRNTLGGTTTDIMPAGASTSKISFTVAAQYKERLDGFIDALTLINA